MLKRFSLLLCFLGTIFLVSCKGRNEVIHSALLLAESLLDNDPHACLDILESVDTIGRPNRHDAAFVITC